MSQAAFTLAEQLVRNPELKPYWDGCAEGRLMLTRCLDTGRLFTYPRGVSPFTLSSNIEWVEASGNGVVYALSRIEASPPYVLAYVTLVEGPTIMTGLVYDEAGALKIGDSVQVTFREVEGGYKAPFFAPA
jgi:uncharacterized OB-fold protein